MKKLLILMSLAPSLLLAQTGGLTLAETRAQVLANNPSVRESLQRIEAADAVLKQAKSAYLPTISFNASQFAIDTSIHPDFDPGTRYSESLGQQSVGVTGSWLLFDGFARRANTLAAKYNVQSQQELADETRRLLLLSTTVSFRQAQLAAESMRIAERDQQFNSELEAEARKRFEAGTIPEAEVHNFAIRALQAESSFLQAQLSFKTAGTVLAQLMALPDAQLSPDQQPIEIQFDVPASVPVLATELDYALSHRPDYKAMWSGQLALGQKVRAAKGAQLPSVALQSGISYVENEDVSTYEDYGNAESYVGVALQWDLFTGGRKKGAVTEAQAEMRVLNEQLESLRLSIRSALRQRIDEAETSYSIFQRQQKIFDLTTAVRDSVEKSYKAGVASVTRLNEAQTDLTRAAGAYASSCISYQLSLNQLEVETGRVLVLP